MYWSAALNDWSTAGCAVANFTAHNITCVCDHLSDFASKTDDAAATVGAVVSLAGSLTLDDLLSALGVIVSLLVLFAAFVFGFVYTRLLDKQDERRERETPAETKLRRLREKNSVVRRMLQSLAPKHGWLVGALENFRDAMKDEHELFMVLFVGADLNFTRFERMLVFACLVAGIMFANALVFEYTTLDPGAPPLEKLAAQAVVGAVAGVGGALFAVPLKLVFKRTGHRPLQEDDFLDRKPADLGVALREDVANRHVVLQAADALRVAREALDEDRELLEGAFALQIQRAARERADDKSTLELRAARYRVARGDVEEKGEARLRRCQDALAVAVKAHARAKRQRHERYEHEVGEAIRELKHVRRFLAKRKHDAAMAKRRAYELMTVEEQAVCDAEAQQLERLGAASKLLYAQLHTRGPRG